MLSRSLLRRTFLALFFLAAMILSAFIADAHGQSFSDVNATPEAPDRDEQSSISQIPSWAEPRMPPPSFGRSAPASRRNMTRNGVDLPATPDPVPVDDHLFWLVLSGGVLALVQLRLSSPPHEPRTPS